MTGMSELTLDSVLSTEARAFVDMVFFLYFVHFGLNINLHIQCNTLAATKNGDGLCLVSADAVIIKSRL